MNTYVVNSEYEHILFENILGSTKESSILKIRQARQYLFYFINKDPQARLRSFQDLDAENEDYLRSVGALLPNLVNEGEGLNWYGSLTNLELERKLNNKIETYKLLESFGDLPPHARVVSTALEMKQHIKSAPVVKSWILKAPYFCGGKGVQIITNESEIPESIPFPHILEPNLNRVVDLAIYYEPKSNLYFPYVSLIQKNGVYRGGRVYQDQDHLERDLKQDGIYDVFMGVVENARKYLDQLKQFPLEQPVTLDSFLYLDDRGQLKGYPLCEINYRISMGTLNHSLQRFLPEGGVGFLVALGPKVEMDWKKILPYDPVNRTGVLSLNSGNPHSEIILVCAPDSKKLNRYKEIVFEREKA
jgi:hypothetical protein